MPSTALPAAIAFRLSELESVDNMTGASITSWTLVSQAASLREWHIQIVRAFLSQPQMSKTLRATAIADVETMLLDL